MAMLLVISVFKCRYHLVQKKKFKKQTSENNLRGILFFFYENGMFEIFSWGKFLHKGMFPYLLAEKVRIFCRNVVEGNSVQIVSNFPAKSLSMYLNKIFWI